MTINGVFPIVTSLVVLFGIILVMLQLDWLLTMLALSVYPLLDACAYQRDSYGSARA